MVEAVTAMPAVADYLGKKIELIIDYGKEKYQADDLNRKFKEVLKK